MKLVFADTFYWVAVFNKRGEWHDRVQQYAETLKQVHLLTTDEVLTEVLTFFAAYGARRRHKTVARVQEILSNTRIQVIQQSRESFLAGLDLYAKRLDKEYSLTDCISMQVMRQLGITDVLTRDRHFTQEGFTILFNENA
ncbi:MAG: type II toxin-antitoxin system VapC family toxin [Stenomitos frigidus ULC029]